MATRANTRTKPTKPAPAPEPEDEDVDEVEETDEVATPSKATEVTFGVADLVKLIKEKTGRDTTTRELRTLLRKMARDGRLDREIIAGNRSRYDWSGPKDPEVLAVLKAFKAGELDADKKEKLQALKDRKAEQRAAAQAAAEKSAAKPAKGKSKPAPVEVDEDDDEELDEDDE